MSSEPAKVIVVEEGSGCLGKSMARACAAASLLFLLNFAFGVIEMPDRLPVVGNIDETLATSILIASLRYLGIGILPFKSKRLPQ